MHLTLSYYYQSVIIPASILLPVFFGLIYFNNIGKPGKILLSYLVISGLINLIAILNSKHQNNLPLLHIYTLVEGMLLLWYFTGIGRSRKFVKAAYLALALFPFLCGADLLLQNRFQYNSYVRSLEALLMICFSVRSYYEEYSDTENDLIRYGPQYWFNAGILFYFSSSLFVFIFSNIMVAYMDHTVAMIIVNIHDTFVFIMYLFFTIGFYKCRQHLTAFSH